jgi:hypothetical protein
MTEENDPDQAAAAQQSYLNQLQEEMGFPGGEIASIELRTALCDDRANNVLIQGKTWPRYAIIDFTYHGVEALLQQSQDFIKEAKVAEAHRNVLQTELAQHCTATAKHEGDAIRALLWVSIAIGSFGAVFGLVNLFSRQGAGQSPQAVQGNDREQLDHLSRKLDVMDERIRLTGNLVGEVGNRVDLGWTYAGGANNAFGSVPAGFPTGPLGHDPRPNPPPF